MMRFENPNLEREFQRDFELDLKDISPQMMMWMVKLAKHIRGRCRSNAALLNYLKLNFKHLKFSTVEREWKGKTYDALCIESKEKKVIDEEGGEE